MSKINENKSEDEKNDSSYETIQNYEDDNSEEMQSNSSNSRYSQIKLAHFYNHIGEYNNADYLSPFLFKRSASSLVRS